MQDKHKTIKKFNIQEIVFIQRGTGWSLQIFPSHYWVSRIASLSCFCVQRNWSEQVLFSLSPIWKGKAVTFVSITISRGIQKFELLNKLTQTIFWLQWQLFNMLCIFLSLLVMLKLVRVNQGLSTSRGASFMITP